jgi:hypothetical protein
MSHSGHTIAVWLVFFKGRRAPPKWKILPTTDAGQNGISLCQLALGTRGRHFRTRGISLKQTCSPEPHASVGKDPQN